MRRKYADELTSEELRRLLVERRRGERRARLEVYRRTGRVVLLEPPPVAPRLEALRSQPEPAEDTPPKEQRNLKRRTVIDKMLLGIEILALLGLVFILYNGFLMLRDLNRETASILEQPTLTPTALIRAVVLPSGHTAPSTAGISAPNEAEIPEHLRPLLASIAGLPVPTAAPDQAIRIQIPSLGVDAPVVQGDGWEQLKQGVGQYLGSPAPGQAGNLVLSAHNDIYGEIFRNLDRLNPGDEVIIFTGQRTYTYRVRQTQVVEPTRVDVMAPTQEAVLTLISCYPYLVDDQRIVVTAELKDE